MEQYEKIIRKAGTSLTHYVSHKTLINMKIKWKRVFNTDRHSRHSSREYLCSVNANRLLDSTSEVLKQLWELRAPAVSTSVLRKQRLKDDWEFAWTEDPVGGSASAITVFTIKPHPSWLCPNMPSRVTSRKGQSIWNTVLKYMNDRKIIVTVLNKYLPFDS